MGDRSKKPRRSVAAPGWSVASGRTHMDLVRSGSQTMRHQHGNRRRGWLSGKAARAVGLTLGLAIGLAGPNSRAQEAPPNPAPTLPLTGTLAPELAPGTAIIAPDGA